MLTWPLNLCDTSCRWSVHPLEGLDFVILLMSFISTSFSTIFLYVHVPRGSWLAPYPLLKPASIISMELELKFWCLFLTLLWGLDLNFKLDFFPLSQIILYTASRIFSLRQICLKTLVSFFFLHAELVNSHPEVQSPILSSKVITFH